MRDLRIGASRKIIAANLVAIIEDLQQRGGECFARGAAIADQRAVDVEERELAHRGTLVP